MGDVGCLLFEGPHRVHRSEHRPTEARAAGTLNVSKSGDRDGEVLALRLPLATRHSERVAPRAKHPRWRRAKDPQPPHADHDAQQRDEPSVGDAGKGNGRRDTAARAHRGVVTSRPVRFLNPGRPRGGSGGKLREKQDNATDVGTRRPRGLRRGLGPSAGPFKRSHSRPVLTPLERLEMPPEGLQHPAIPRKKQGARHEVAAKSAVNTENALLAWLEACPIPLSPDDRERLLVQLIASLRTR